jgi:hypothetical protein
MEKKTKSIFIEKGKFVKTSGLLSETINYPVFCFKYLHKDYHLDKCTNDEKRKFIEQILRISSMSWEQLQLAPKHGTGSEKISPHSIKTNIPNHFSEEVGTLLAFRFDGKKPFVGFRNGFIFHIFYIDRDFTLYNHA